MNLNTSKIKPKDFPSAFLDMIHTNCVDDVQQILNRKNVKEYLSTDCLFLGLISAANLRELAVFDLLCEFFKKEKIKIPDFMLEKLFNSICSSKSIERLQILDNSFNLSKHMMTNSSIIDEYSIIKEDPTSYFSQVYAIYSTHKEELLNTFNEHGLITASKDGNNALINYLLSTPVEIPTKLIEASFIASCNNNQFETAMIVYSKLSNIRDSEFIKKFVKSLTEPNDEKLHFVCKLMLKDEIQNELSTTNNPTIKKNKI
jgi:hypothetical protein